MHANEVLDSQYQWTYEPCPYEWWVDPLVSYFLKCFWFSVPCVPQMPFSQFTILSLETFQREVLFSIFRKNKRTQFMHKTKFIQCVMYILGDPHKKLQCLRATSARTKKKRFRTTTRNFQTFVRFAYLVFSGGDFKKKKKKKQIIMVRGMHTEFWIHHYGHI